MAFAHEVDGRRRCVLFSSDVFEALFEFCLRGVGPVGGLAEVLDRGGERGGAPGLQRLSRVGGFSPYPPACNCPRANVSVGATTGCAAGDRGPHARTAA